MSSLIETPLNDLCRLCTGKCSASSCFPIFSDDGNVRRDIYKKIKYCLSIHVRITPYLIK